MDIIINDNYELIVSKAKKAADKTEEIKKDLAKIRAKLDDYYDGRIDFDSDIKAIEKRLGNQADNMMKLANAIDDSICGLVETDRIGIQAVTTAAKSSISSINLSDTSPNSMVHSVKSFVSNFTKKAYDVVTDMFDNSATPFTGTLIGSAALGAISSVISGKQPHTSGSGNSSGGISVDVSSADTFPAGYDKYRAAVERVNNANVPIQQQVYKVNSDGVVVKRGGRCNVAAMTQLLNNRLALDGKEAERFTPEDVFAANDCVVKKHSKTPYDSENGKYKAEGTTGYEVDGSTGSWGNETKDDGSLRIYTNSNGTSYSIERHTKLQNAITSAAKKGDIDSCKQMSAEELHKHPEGIAVRVQRETLNKDGKTITKEHVVVFTDYNEVDGKITFNVQDGVANRGQTHDGELSETYFWNTTCGTDDSAMFKCITHIVSLK
ncbi:MAG: hypothetical protein IJ395_08595 [Clostridia bacterium]|nr:hypothetical protein [Clostridia bacterium]